MRIIEKNYFVIIGGGGVLLEYDLTGITDEKEKFLFITALSLIYLQYLTLPGAFTSKRHFIYY
jgi:hypothetical protein